MIAIYKTVSKKQIKQDVKDSIPKIEEWFKQNPKRRICAAGLWYGKVIAIRRGHVAEDMNAAAKEAMER